MYARYTSFNFAESDWDRILEFWENVGVPSIRPQPGWLGATILESAETPGRLRIVTLWEAKEDFDRYFTSPEHKQFGATFAELGLKVAERDGLIALHHLRPTGILRIIRARPKPESAAEIATFWQTIGQPLISRQPGSLRAEAYWEAESGEFVLVLAWRTLEDSQRFTASADHVEFAAGLDPHIAEIVERRTLTQI